MKNYFKGTVMNIKRSSSEYHRSFACIDLTAIKANFDALKSKTAPGTKAMAVVKANAYGHGAIRVAKALSGRADYFAVADIGEATELRDGGITEPILILSYTFPSQFETLLNHSIIPTVFSLDDAKELSEAACRLDKSARIHVAVDTGMGRIGFTDDEKSVGIIKEISNLKNIEIEGLFTHFACADMADKTSLINQKKRFDAFIAKLESAGVCIPIKHACNSAATIEADFCYDMVRMGISLYGLYPSDEVDSESIRLTPAMEVMSHIIHVKDVEAGTAIGYGHTYVASEKRRIATVCIGYADGFNRAFSNKGYVLIHGQKAPVTGRVCMDQIMVDVTDIPQAAKGDYVVILGSSDSERITAEELGAMCESFNYEVICTFMPRVTRLYFEDGKEI